MDRHLHHRKEGRGTVFGLCLIWLLCWLDGRKGGITLVEQDGQFHPSSYGSAASYHMILQVGEYKAIFLYSALALGSVLLPSPFQTVLIRHSHRANQTRTNRLARPLSHWKRGSSLYNRGVPGANVSDRDQPRRSDPTSIHSDRKYWLDRRIRSGWKRSIAICYWRISIEIWYWCIATFVRSSFPHRPLESLICPHIAWSQIYVLW
jgi:hypothetical protein